LAAAGGPPVGPAGYYGANDYYVITQHTIKIPMKIPQSKLILT